MTILSRSASVRAAEETQRDLTRRFRLVRGETEQLCASLSAEDQLVQSMADASPVKWHRGHTTWFFEEFVLARDAAYRRFHPRFAFLFNSYYEAVGARHPRPARGLLSRPDLAEIAAWRASVDDALITWLERDAADPEALALIELGLHHEQQHQELLLTDILHAFAHNPLFPAYQSFMAAPVVAARPMRFLDIQGGIVSIGHEGERFAFDNESPRHRVFIEPFAIADRLVTNAEWCEFVDAGGYRQPEHWLADGWTCVRNEGWQAPLYWQEGEGGWHQMTLSGLLPLEPDAPVSHISFYEADAFARWRGKRLPSEAEWEHAASLYDAQRGHYRDSGHLRPLAARDPQFFGDCWEWTASAYTPYPGFKAASGAVGEYNGKFMVNQMVLRGGSCVTPASHMRKSYRNFFYPHQRWQFAGVRLADAPASRSTRAVHAVSTSFLNDVLEGLAQPQKSLKSKYFYDTAGSELFEQICTLPEYYLTRTETALLADVAVGLADDVASGTALVEFGSGSSTKTRLLLSNIPAITHYVPVEIHEEFLLACVAALKDDYPQLDIHPLAADFMERVDLPQAIARAPRLGFFPGSTIGNLSAADAVRFLTHAREGLGSGGRLIIGIDLVKDVETLISAYDDAQGITAAFNLNLLSRINRELDGGFDLGAFAHVARWNRQKSRIEMHLESRTNQVVMVAGRPFRFRRGETIHTENSHKYSVEGFAALAARAGWRPRRTWLGPEHEFAVILLEQA